jgi:hypothetical protein
VTFFTEQGEVNKDSEASHNSALKPLSRGMRPELFDFSRNPHRESTTMSVDYAVQESDAWVRSPPKVRPTGAVQYDRFTSTYDRSTSRSAAGDTAAIKKRPHVAYSRKPEKSCPFPAILPRRARLMCGRARPISEGRTNCKSRRAMFAAFPLLLIGLPAFAQDIGDKLIRFLAPGVV